MSSKYIKKTEPLGFQWKAMDPFLFCVHHQDAYPKGNGAYGPDVSLLRNRDMGSDFSIRDGWRMYHGQRVPGFPVHPHRGFETVTMVRKGLVDHTDSMKAAGRYGNGDVQWMTAGQGVQHAEMFPLVNEEEGNPLELFQIWLNLPAKSKMVQPYFSMFWDKTIPKYQSKDTNGKGTLVEVIAGEIDGFLAPEPPPESWASVSENEVAIWNIKMEAEAEFELPKAGAGVNRVLYFYEGKDLNINDTVLPEYHMAVLKPEAGILLKTATETSILILQGKPINEPVIQHGPFVLNTEEEVQETIMEYQQTHFGGWPWPSYEPTHGRQERFAQYSDGRVEKP